MAYSLILREEAKILYVILPSYWLFMACHCWRHRSQGRRHWPLMAEAILGRGDRAFAYFMRKAGTTILAISILLWVATSFPKPASHRVDAQIAAGTVIAP